MKDSSLDSTDLTWLAGLARALLGEAHAADDLVQETAVAALRGAPPAGAPRRAWLGSVARRLAARRFRSEARRERREEVAARPEALPDSAELVERAEVAEQVTAAARRLPEPFRRTILLRFLEGRSPEEIAREEGKPADTVRWRVRRGLELLREELVREHDRDWSSWSVLLMPLARFHGELGLATAGAAGVSTGTVASLTAMKVTMAVAAAVGCVGLWLGWESGDAGAGDALVGVKPAARDAVQAEATAEVEAGEVPVERAAARTEVTTPPAIEEPAPAAVELDAVAGDLVGEVVDEDGAPVAGATVYLVPSVQARGTSASDEVRTQTESDWRGAFRLAREDALSGADEGEPALDLGVVANGFRRRVVPDVMQKPAGERLRVVLERGRTLSGRVIDEFGRPVPDLELLAHSAHAGIGHVSPSQRLLRARRRELAGASSAYDQCRATTDGRGNVAFTGLPSGELGVLALDPGWTLEAPSRVLETDTYVEWTARRRLGVRLIVTDVRTGRPVDRSAATFRFEVTFADGEVRDFGQWVGRGGGEVSFVLGAEALPGLDERTITRATFYGTVRSGEGERVDWVAEPIEDPTRAVGVAEVRVEVDPSAPPQVGPAADADGSESPEDVGTAILEVDARYADATPFEGELTVSWAARTDPSDYDRGRAEAVGIGRYRVEVPARDLVLQVKDRFASGSLPPWTDDVRLEPGQEAKVFATLPRGATATITRPEGWGGEWFVHASWKPQGAEDWQGSLGYSTDESRMTLTVLQPAEWRFELRRYSALEPDPLVHTVLLEEGETAVVDE